MLVDMRLRRWIEQARLDEAFPLPRHDPFTFTRARAAGLSRRELRCLVERHLVRRVVRGVYLSNEVPDDLTSRARALALVTPAGCVVVDRHAGWLLGAEMALAPGEHVALRPLSLYRPAGAGRLRNQLSSSGERDLGPNDVIEVHGLRVTTPLRTAYDLGRVPRVEAAIAGLDSMLRLGAFEHDELMAGVERFRRTRWITTLRAVAPLADGRSESPAESVTRLRCHECQLTGMVPQVEVRRDGSLLARLDLGDEELMAAVEYDGAEWHSSPGQVAHDRARRTAVRAEGWLVAVVTRDNVFGQQRDIEDVLHRLGEDARRRARRTA